MLTGRTVLVLAADLFEDIELLYPVHRLREEGVEVTIAGLDDHPVTGKKGHGPVAVDAVVDDLDARTFDALVIPGGYAPDKLRRHRRCCAWWRRSTPRPSPSPSSATPA